VKNKSSFYFGLKNLFQRNILAFSLLINLPVLFEPQMIAQFLSAGEISSIWLLWANAIGFAFGTVFIAPLWKKLPIKLENEIHNQRYSGNWSVVLSKFRAIFLGILVIPLIGAQLILSFTTIVASVIGLDKAQTIILTGFFMLLILFTNNINNRIRTDAIIGISGLLLLIVIGCQWTFNEAANSIGSINASYSLFEIEGGWTTCAFIFGFHWIATGIYDFPDMEGQKLISSANKNDSIQLFRLILFMIIAQYFVYSLGYRAFLSYGHANSSGEAIIGNYLIQSNSFIKYPLLLFVFIVFSGTIMNFQLWSGSLISTILPRREKQSKLFGMIVFTLFTVVWSLSNSTVWGVVKYLFVISAGVGPVFLLRWFWYRITAKVQLVAMVSSLVYANLYILLLDNSPVFERFTLALSSHLGLKPYFIEVLIVTICVVFTWLLVLAFDRHKSKADFTKFNSFTNGLSELRNPKNWIAFILLCVLILSSRVFSWYLVIGDYYVSFILSIILLVSIGLYFFVLKKKHSNA
jgi:hypothetical protein